jgi:CRP/FNR family transcriptional regulator, cyclic AMP receptor protein
VSFFDYPNEPPASSGPPELLLADASDQEWATLLQHTRYRRFNSGDAIITVGEQDQSLYLVLEGQLEVLAEHGRGRYRRIATVDAGSVIGELAFFDGGARSALVRAMSPAVLAELSPAEFDSFATANPTLARRLLLDLGRILARRLRAAQQSPSVVGVN